MKKFILISIYVAFPSAFAVGSCPFMAKGAYKCGNSERAHTLIFDHWVDGDGAGRIAVYTPEEGRPESGYTCKTGTEVTQVCGKSDRAKSGEMREACDAQFPDSYYVRKRVIVSNGSEYTQNIIDEFRRLDSDEVVYRSTMAIHIELLNQYELSLAVADAQAGDKNPKAVCRYHKKLP